jgi:transposase
MQKKRLRPMEQSRPDVRAKRQAFLKKLRRVPVSNRVFLDESGANTAMQRSHAWIKRGTELVAPKPMNWGDNLTMIGAVRRSGWVTMSTAFQTANRGRFTEFVRKHLAPRLRRGDVVILDNAQAHKGPDVPKHLKRVGAKLLFLPPYSPDMNPIEPAWALVKKDIKRVAPRTASDLRKSARAARYRVTPAHLDAWFHRANRCVRAAATGADTNDLRD